MSDILDFPLSSNGGMNQDDSLVAPPDGQNLFESGDYRYARNCRIGDSIDSNNGGTENLPSTLKVQNYLMWNGSIWTFISRPAGTTKVNGKYIDFDEGCIYYAIYSSYSQHVIVKFDTAAQTAYELLRWDGLNFAANTIISMSKVNKYLIFTDNINPPRIIDTQSIYTLKYTLGTAFSEYHISFSKWPPLAPAIISGVNSAATDLSPLHTSLFQFTYRYVYVGGFRSTFAPPSRFVSNYFGNGSTDYQFKLLFNGFLFDYNSPASTSFQHTDQKFYQFVQYIECFYRQSETDTWKLFNRLTVDKVTPANNTTVTFSLNGPNAVISQSESGQYFDSVPLHSGCVEVIDNRVMMGNNEDDFTMPTFDVSNVGVASVTSATDNWWIGANRVDAEGIGRYTFKERGIYKLGIVFQHWTGRTSQVVTLDKWVYNIPQGTTPSGTENQNEDFHALQFKIAGGINPPSWAVAYQIVRTNCLNLDFFLFGEVNDFIFLRNDPTAVAAADQVSTASAIQTAISNYYNYRQKSGSGYPLINEVVQATRKNQTVATFANCSQVYIDVNNWALNSVGNGALDNPPNNCFYNWLPGDRVRLWGLDGGGNYQLYDAEIVSFTGRGIIINKPQYMSDLKNRAGAAVKTKIFTIEVYRNKPVDLQNAIYYECSEWYPITAPGTSSAAFSKTDWTWSGSANVVKTTVNGQDIYSKMPVYIGDVCWVSKHFYHDYVAGWFGGGVDSGITIWMQMNQDPTNPGLKWEHFIGRPWIAYRYPPVLITKTTQVRFGGRFLEDSVYVSINTFRDEAQYIYPSEYGKVRALVNTNNAQIESVGNILLYIGETESVSIYINRTTLESLNGSQQVSLSDKVLGSFNTLIGSFGTRNPESVTVRNGRVIWWCDKKGTWVRYSRDGLTEISKFKMKNWFKDFGALMSGYYGYPDTLAFYGWTDFSTGTAITYTNGALQYSTIGSSKFKVTPFATKAGKTYAVKLDVSMVDNNQQGIFLLQTINSSGSVVDTIKILGLGDYLAALASFTGTIQWTASADGDRIGIRFNGTLSDAGTWFANVNEVVDLTYEPRVISTYDEYYDEWITRADHYLLPSTFKGYSSYKCVSFAERNGDHRWKSVYDFTPDMFASFNNEVYGLKTVYQYLHEGGADYGYIYEVTQPSQIELVANIHPRTVKTWRNLALITTDKWSVESMYGDWKSNGGTSQNSKVLLTDWQLKEGQYYAAIKRDTTSPNASSADNALNEGNIMKSSSLRMLFQLDPSVNWLTALYWVIVGYSPSPKTFKNSA